MCGDERRLRQVLLNVLGNAVKFTERGGVTFKVGYHEVEPGVVRVRFQVEDTGVGIVPEKLEEIFQPFQQIRSKDDPIEGMGLGLSISRRLVALMGGTLHVKKYLRPGQCLLARNRPARPGWYGCLIIRTGAGRYWL